MYFEYGEREKEYLRKKDKALGAAIDKIGHIKRGVDDDLFASVVHHIVGQQISTSAQKTIWGRLEKTLGTICAEGICSLSREDLQSHGITFRKADYILDFSEKVQAGVLSLHTLYSLADEEVIKELTKLKGIGVWTAEMIMLFCMRRPDIVSYGDLAILRGMRMLYRHKDISRERFRRYKKRYSPYGSVASLYLWAIAGGAIPELEDRQKRSGK